MVQGKVVYTTDKDGRYTWICKGVESISGYTQEELIGKSAFDLIYPDDLPAVTARFVEPIETEVYREESFRVVDKDGSVVKILSRSIRKPDGTILGVFDRREQDR